MCKIFYKKVIYIALSLFIAVLMSFGYFFPVLTSFADDDSLAFDKTNVMDDLNSSVVDGQAFDLKTYSFDSKKELQILSFIEYGYSFYGDLQDNYGLYVYVYNPQGLKIESDSNLHGITLAFGEATDEHFTHYALEFLSKSEESNYSRLFYKFKVNMSRTQKQTALDTLNSTERVYRIGALYLKQEKYTSATAFNVGRSYKVSGYSKGYGPDEEADSTLMVARGEEQETITLKVKPAYYRPDGTSGKNDYTRDSLHSVYFAVPNEYIEKYGYMMAVHAKWLDAVLKPMLVTGNEDAYNAILPYLGRAIKTAGDGSSYNSDLGYTYLGADDSRYDASVGLYLHYVGFSYNAAEVGSHFLSCYPGGASLATGGTSSEYVGKGSFGSEVTTLYGLFPTSDFSENSADTYRVSSSTMQTWLESTKSKYGGELVNGKYSKKVFESVASSWTDITYTSDYKYQDGEYKLFDLRNEKISKNFWQKLFGGSTVTSNNFNGLECIQEVEGLTGKAETDCAEYFLDTACYEEFKNYYNVNKSGNTIYIFRYQVSDYVGQEATLYKYKKSLGVPYLGKVDTNAYFFQETVSLDFTIIDLTFSNGEKYTVIPVVADPVDNVPGSTEPVYTTKDGEGIWATVSKWLKRILAVVLIVLLCIVLAPLFPHIINLIVWILKGVIWLLTLPFKLISKIIKSFKKKE